MAYTYIFGQFRPLFTGNPMRLQQRQTRRVSAHQLHDIRLAEGQQDFWATMPTA